MPTIYARNCSDDLYEKIRALAEQGRRSFSAEVLVLLDKAVQGEDLTARRLRALEEMAQRRRSFKLPPGAQDSLSMLREDRER